MKEEIEKVLIESLQKLDQQIKDNIYNEEYNKKEYDYIDVLTYQRVTVDLILNKIERLK